MDSIEFECDKSRLVIDKSANFIHFTYEDKVKNIELVSFPVKNLSHPGTVVRTSIETDYSGCEFYVLESKGGKLLYLKISKASSANNMRFIPYYLSAEIYILDDKERTDKVLQIVELIKSL
jgi:hypothetical protein